MLTYGRYPDCPRPQPPLAAEDNLNPERAEEGLCPAQPASERPGALWPADATSHRSEWAATKQVHIDENHGTLRRVETNGLAAGAKSSPAMLECVQPRWENMAISLGLVPAEPAPSTRLTSA